MSEAHHHSNTHPKPTPPVPRAIPSEQDVYVEANEQEETTIPEPTGIDDDSDADDSNNANGHIILEAPEQALDITEKIPRKRKRKQDEPQIEDVYMQRLALQEAKDAERHREIRQKRLKSNADGLEGGSADVDAEEETGRSDVQPNNVQDGSGTLVPSQEAGDDDEEGGALSPPPKHETEQMADAELAKANRTVFVGNVSTTAITSKTAQKLLRTFSQRIQAFDRR